MFKFSFIFERQKERDWGRGREKETENPKRFQAVSAEFDVGLQLMRCEIMTSAKV